MNDELRYPVGRFEPPASVTPADRAGFIDVIANAPARMRAAVAGLDDSQLDAPYRPGGWTVRQVVHHVPDSHMNAYVRFRLALTEPNPVIRPYNEADWAQLPDARSGPVAYSLALLESLHARWVALLRAMTDEDFARTYRHPDQPGRDLPLSEVLANYAWHSRHHVAHITRLRDRMGW
jgi:uncharacterized damage-inducible protein DinB